MVLVLSLTVGCSQEPVPVATRPAVKQKISNQAPAPPSAQSQAGVAVNESREKSAAPQAPTAAVVTPQKVENPQTSQSSAPNQTASALESSPPAAAKTTTEQNRPAADSTAAPQSDSAPVMAMAQPAASAMPGTNSGPVETTLAVSGTDGGASVAATAVTPAAGVVTGTVADTTKSTSELIQESLKIAASYDPQGRFDPFEPLFKQEAEITAVPQQKGEHKKRVPQTPLERVSLSQLKLSAIIRAAAGDRALVEDATGKGYVVSNGTFIGLNSGKVVRIEKDRIVIEEEIENVMGEFTVQSTELKIQKPAGEL